MPIVIAFLSGEPRQGRMKIGGALLSGMRDVAPADDAVARPRRSRRRVRTDRGAVGRRIGRHARAAAARAVRPRDARRAGFSHPAAVRRAASGRARRRPDGRGGARVRHPGRHGSAARRCSPATSRRWRGRRSSTATPRCRSSSFSPFQPVQPMLAESAADVGDALADARRGVVRVQARRRAHPGAQGRRRGEGLLAEPARRHARGARGRRPSRARCRRARSSSTARRSRCAPDGSAASVPGHDAPLRPQARRRRPAARAADHADVLRRALSRRRPARRRAADAGAWRCSASRSRRRTSCRGMLTAERGRGGGVRGARARERATRA